MEFAVILSDFAKLRIGTYLQNTGVTTLNYTSPVVYNVIAQNGTIEYWTVTIQVAKPTITLLGNTTIALDKGCAFTEPGYTASDITSAVVVSGIIDVNTTGQYTLSYNVKDALQNETIMTRTINVSRTDCTLGLPTNIKNDFVLYPNPVTNQKVFIKTESNSTQNIWVSDMSGRQLLSVQTQKTELNLSGLPTGVYIIKVKQDGNTSTQKLIIK